MTVEVAAQDALTRKVDALASFVLGLIDSIEEAASNPMLAAFVPSDLGEQLAEVRAALTDD